MSYKYMVLKIRRPEINQELERQAADGWKILHVTPIQEVKGVKMNGQPEFEFFYDVFFEKLR